MLWIPGWGSLFLSPNNCKDRLWTRKGLFTWYLYNLVSLVTPTAFTCWKCCWAGQLFPKYPRHKHGDHFLAPELPRSDPQTLMWASHPSCCLMHLRITSILQLPAPSTMPWHKAGGSEITCCQCGWQTKALSDPACSPTSVWAQQHFPDLKSFFFFLSGNWGDQSQRTAVREEKSCPQQGCQSLAICSESYISLLLMNKLISNTRNQRQLTGNTHLLLPSWGRAFASCLCTQTYAN